jgi:regulatory protein
MIILRFDTNAMESEKPVKKMLDKRTAHIKLEQFCAYQERSQQEVRDKLYSYGLHAADVEEVIADLITSNFINEERFAKAYALGKFRIKHWGRMKIKQGLKLKRVGDKLITKALNEIDADDYERSLTTLLVKKAALMKEKDDFKRKQKLLLFAVSKGYEHDIVLDCLKSSALLKN